MLRSLYCFFILLRNITDVSLHLFKYVCEVFKNSKILCHKFADCISKLLFLKFSLKYVSSPAACFLLAMLTKHSFQNTYGIIDVRSCNAQRRSNINYLMKENIKLLNIWSKYWLCCLPVKINSASYNFKHAQAQPIVIGIKPARIFGHSRWFGPKQFSSELTKFRF